MRTFTKRVLFSLNILVVLLFVGSASAIHVSPEYALLPAFLGLAFPYLALLNIFFGLFWFYHLKVQFLLSSIAFLAGWGQYGSLFQLSFEHAKNTDTKVEITSHNLRAFGLNGPIHQTTSGRKIFKYYRDKSSDIYCFQEFFSSTNNNFSPLDSMINRINPKFTHIKYSVHFRGNSFGIATFSDFPIVDTGTVNMKGQGTNMCIYTDININKTIHRVYNMHLASLHFQEEELKYIENIAEQSNEQHMEKASNLVEKLADAFVRRTIQAEIIAKHIEDSPYPVIICGDLNDNPYSYTYGVFSNEMKDAFLEKGTGIGQTYNGKIPNLRIDYIFVPERTQVHDFKTDKVDLSDHFPITAKLIFK